MLDNRTIQLIQSTVPVLEKHGEQITTRFYQLMFSQHPELYNIFNVIHQKKKEQQKALAQAIYQAAVHIDRLPHILPVMQRVFQKHRSLGVKAEHYPIVGKYLFIAIKDVLGDVATAEIMDAWKTVYGILAEVFISEEQKLYERAKSEVGGWDGWRKFIVKKKVPESKVITSFYLYPADQQPLPSYLPGQYISLKTFCKEFGYSQIRQYSLSDAPDKEYYRISVKREDGNDQHPPGIVSTYLHNIVQEGDTIHISAPAGDFYLDTNGLRPVVFISGGVGLTPLLSMLNSLLDADHKQPITFIHAAINSEFHAFNEYIQKVKDTQPQVSAFTCYERPTDLDRQQNTFDHEGLIDEKWLEQIIPTIHADFYFCGPIPFMQTINDSLKKLGVASENIHYEFFGPASLIEKQTEVTLKTL